jgi:hypothetical protein
MQPTTPSNDNPAVMNEVTIVKALQEVRDRISHAEHHRAELDRAIKAAREEERLLLRILALRRGDTGEGQNPAVPENDLEKRDFEHEGLLHGENSKHSSLQAVVRELAVAGRPLHISDLMRRLREAGIQIPGAGTQANLITHLRRDTRIVRPSRGMYGLLAWGMENMPTTTRKRRRRRIVRAKAAKEGTKA